MHELTTGNDVIFSCQFQELSDAIDLLHGDCWFCCNSPCHWQAPLLMPPFCTYGSPLLSLLINGSRGKCRPLALVAIFSHLRIGNLLRPPSSTSRTGCSDPMCKPTVGNRASSPMKIWTGALSPTKNLRNQPSCENYEVCSSGFTKQWCNSRRIPKNFQHKSFISDFLCCPFHNAFNFRCIVLQWLPMPIWLYCNIVEGHLELQGLVVSTSFPVWHFIFLQAFFFFYIYEVYVAI
jgi:hypothetical protein